MKKIACLFSTALLLIMTAIPSMAYEYVNVEAVDVQTTYIDFVFDGDKLNSALEKSLETPISTFEDAKGNDILRIKVSNVSFADNFNDAMEELIYAAEENQPEIAEIFKNKNIEIESSFFGFPFGGRTTLNINTPNPENDINVKIDGSYSLNNGDYNKSGVITAGDYPAYVEYGTNTANSLKITIEPEDNYKSVYVTFDITSNSGEMLSMDDSAYELQKYTVLYKNSNDISLGYTYNDIGEFNNLFNLDLVRIFGVVGNMEMKSGKSLMNNMTITGKFAESESIDEVTLTVKMPETATDEISGYTGDSFTYDITGKAEMNISFTKLNTSTMIILIIVPVCIFFVLASLLMLNKRGSHIRIK